MTCVVGIEFNGGALVAADSFSGNSFSADVVAVNSKVFRLGPFIIGIAGSWRFGDVLRYGWSVPERMTSEQNDAAYLFRCMTSLREACAEHGIRRKEDEHETVADDGVFMLAYNNRVYCMHGDFHLLRSIRGYSTLGAGEAYAAGALEVIRQTGGFPDMDSNVASEIATLALDVACTLSPAVRGPYFTLFQGDELGEESGDE